MYTTATITISMTEKAQLQAPDYLHKMIIKDQKLISNFIRN